MHMLAAFASILSQNENLTKNNMDNSYCINDACECKYLEENAHQYVYLGSCRFSIIISVLKKEKRK
jgi:hypothetical protein